MDWAVMFFDVSLETANRFYTFGWRASIVGAVITAIGVVFLMWGTRVRDHDFESKIPDTITAAADTRERAAKLEKEAAELRKAAVEAETRLHEMRQKIGPRRIDEKIFLAKLADAPKRPVVVTHAPDDPDSYFLANGVLGVLNSAKWDARYSGTTPEPIKWCGAHLGGVLVLTKTMTPEESEDLQKPLQDRRKSAWLSLTDALVDSLAPHSVGLATCPFVADGIIHVVVSPRWVFFPKR